MRKTAVLAAMLFAALATGAPRQAVAQSSDDCPMPKVSVANASYEVSANTASNASAIINGVIESNKGSIRFFQDVTGGGVDVDYALVVTGGESEDGSGSSAILEDRKGRNVASAAGGGGDVVTQLTPMLDQIRDHQRRMREQDQSAIAAELTVKPEKQSIKPGETAVLTVEIKDCDGVVLNREAGIELQGPGSVSPDKVDTTGDIAYQGTETGGAEITGFWKYETTAGIPNVAAGTAVVTVTDEKQQTAERPKGTGAGASFTDEQLARSTGLLSRLSQLVTEGGPK
jgi:hypothetical protein